MARLIVHPTDFSPCARVAFRRALEVARRERAHLVLVHVLEPFTYGDADYMVRELELRDAAVGAARKHFARLERVARRAGVEATGVVLDGGAARAIGALARRRRAHLIVMGTHGRTGLRKLILGSVATAVVATAPCPVLTVRSTRG
jgi:nucleotide-binding universal stress UspA family protein